MPKPLRLLLADNNLRARRGLRAVLEALPALEVVAEAARGDEALRLVEALQPDVALLDVVMPGMDGLQAARAIKAAWPEVRVVLISLYPHYAAEARLSGADAFVVKGCPAEELIEALMGPAPVLKGS